MSFEVINNSTNPLLLSDGKMLAPVGADDNSKRVLDAVDKRDKDYEKRGWISIIEREDKPAADEPTTVVEPPKQQQQQADATKTEANKIK